MILFISCNSENSWDCVQTMGDIVEEERELNEFTRLFAYDRVDVKLVQDTVHKVIIRSGKNLMSDIITKSKDGVLEIQNKNTCSIVRNSNHIPHLEVHFKNLTNLRVYNSQLFYSEDTLNFDDLLIWKISNGTLRLTLDARSVYFFSKEYGDAYFYGNSDGVNIEHEGVGLIDFSAIQAKRGRVLSIGAGRSRLYCTDLFNAEVERNGRIEVFGNPSERNVTIKGDGIIEYMP